MTSKIFKYPLAKCLELIYEYQRTEKKKLFHILLVQFDLLLVDIIHQFRNRRKELVDESLQDMYHSAIVAFDDALKKVNVKEARLLPAFIKAYVVAYFRKIYRYKCREIVIWRPETYGLEDKEIRRLKRIDEALMSTLRKSYLMSLWDCCKLSDYERVCLKYKYWEGMTLKEIAKKTKLSVGQVRYRIRIGLRKLKKAVRREGYMKLIRVTCKSGIEGIYKAKSKEEAKKLFEDEFGKQKRVKAVVLVDKVE